MTAHPSVDSLNRLLADASVFYQKLRHYHWNVRGPHFFALHAKFEELYTAWAEHIDRIAERVLTVGGVPLHTLRSLLERSALEEDEEIPGAEKMVSRLVADMLVLRDTLAQARAEAEARGDDGTVTLLDDIRDGLEKNAWMLRAFNTPVAG